MNDGAMVASPELFIERHFELDKIFKVLVQWHRPVQDDNAFRCDYIIIWPDRRRSSQGFGVDSVQALIMAMQKAHVELLASNEGRAGCLLWLGSRNLDLPLMGSVTPDDFQRPQNGSEA